MPVSATGLHYEFYGDEGLPPVVLSSGLGGLGSYWEPNLLALAGDYRVLAYDHRGTGGSQPEVEASQTVAAMAADVAGLLDELGIDEPVGFVGHALGGLIGLQLAMDDPGRIQRMIVVNGWAALDPHTRRCFEVRGGMLRLQPSLYRLAQPLFLYPPAWISAHDAELRSAELEAPGLHQSDATLLARIDSASSWDPGAYRLGTVTIPVLCVGVEDDFLVPAACAETLAGLLGKGSHASFATGGHAINITRPQEFVLRVQDWLR
ncbi:pyrimidine utilization protein D [Sphingomonas bacterium]|uniref:pyrimidine utilization protein D n=1 Tax=Sphingomonas bacterium TaxID=1895847 RepID=UPI0015751159|nr:pyrimidine utilization protein D [Sphingomonas bacterium]